MKLLQLKNINKRYALGHHQTFHALKDVNVSFEKGELVAIIGESGSGKSTMMNLIGGLDSNFEGELFVEGRNIGTCSEKELDAYRKNKIGFVFQNCHLIPHLSILDNVTIALTLSNVSKQERIAKAREALKQVGLENHMNKRPNQLSGGQRQRVAIARALINDPEIILADEPTGALDSQTTEQVLDIIKEIAQKGKLVIMVTHSEKVAAHCSRIIEILDGQIVKDQNKEETTSEVTEQTCEIKNNEGSVKEKQNLRLIDAIQLAAHNMKQKLRRNILVALGVSIGITSVVMMLALGDGLKDYFSSMIDSFMNPLVVEVSMKPEEMDPSDPQAMMQAVMGSKVPFKEENFEELSKISGVKEVEKGFQYLSIGGTNTVSYGEKQSSLMGITSISSVLTEKNVGEGALPKEGEILMNQSAARELGEDMIGKEVQLSAVIDGETVKGSFKVSGIYRAGENNTMADNNNAIYMHYSDMEKLLKEKERTLEANIVYLVADSEEEASAIKAEIVDLGYGGSTQEIMGEQMLTMLDVLTVVLSAVAAISLVVSSIMILVVLYISVVERTKEIGLLRAIGARRKDIRRIFVSEAFLIGISSGILGLLNAGILSIVVNQGAMKLFDMRLMNMAGTYVAIGIAISTLVSMIAGLFPAHKAAKLDPIESLRME